MENRKNILLLGIGNLLLKDEGIGVRVAEQIKDMDLPPGVEVMDGGTMGLDLLYYIEGKEKVIVIDAIVAGGAPGTLYRFTDKDIGGKKGILRSAHGIDFGDVIHIAQYLKTKPETIVFLGVEPQDISVGMELSPKIEEMIPVLINLVLKEIGLNIPAN
jgi:hydrogenase maturation protease